jgi:leucyl-tRNA synthetase
VCPVTTVLRGLHLHLLIRESVSRQWRSRIPAAAIKAGRGKPRASRLVGCDHREMTENYDPHGVVDKWLKVWDELRTFEATGLLAPSAADEPPPAYVVSMFPYPSGDLHMGHAEVFSISDAFARYLRMRGHNVLNGIGWDSFGLPAENAALKRNQDPREWTYANIEVQAESFRRLGVSFDWRTRLHTSDPEYYRWNQWLFLRLFEHDLAYRREAAVNWCPVDRTVLANEQVIAGCCERCGAVVERKLLTQWFFRITAYAQRLLDDEALLTGKWPDAVLTLQRNWIGRSEGAYIDFEVEGHEPIRVFTTRPDTLPGATFMAVAVDSPLASSLCAAAQRVEFEAYRAATASLSEIERLATDRPKTGVFLGRSAVNPATDHSIPIYAADYVLAEYGTGVVMGVPMHDERDADFAAAMGIDPGDGELREWTGETAVTYRLRDWLLSRQRYWGTPIPIIHCEQCGLVPVPDDQLPLRLPESGYQLRPGDGRSPLETATDWVHVACPTCGGAARRDTDTMDTFVDSSWYFLRYPNPSYEHGPFDPVGIARWLPVDEYIGGREHATGHLLYARFMTKALHDLGLLPFTEPFTRLTNQGQVIMNGKAMSKTLGNLVNLQDQIALYGPDAVRVTMVFAGPPEDDIDWADVSPTGAVKWLNRLWRLTGDVGPISAGVADFDVRRGVHRLIAAATAAMDAHRLNVAVSRLMELTSLLRKAIDGPVGPSDPAVREGAEALVRMASCFAPFTAEEGWQRLGHRPSVAAVPWPVADPTLLIEDEVTCVVQIDGKVRDRLTVPASISAADLEALVVGSSRVATALGARDVVRVVVRPPALVNLVTAA